ncbi:GMC oxidoreductase [Marinibacterium sp. SX1]|uniref:GMC oxidoreductase n=1 Tax=Marinibacterium sp. SX1 TaxID=3388424 RepID=UPI003D171B25
MAMELRDTGIDVVLLVGGDMHFDDAAQSLYAGPNVGIQGWELDESRLRMLGGSTNHWAGNCIPLDPIDFEARPGIPYSGWPITRADLDPYYLRAQAYVETPSADLFDTPERLAAIGPGALDFDPDKLRTFIYAESTPTTFGYTYEEQLGAAPSLRVLVHGSALEIETNDTASEVTGVRAGTISGARFSVVARHYVLAAGGVEIPRLLFLSNKVSPAGLGNGNDLVGRFFSDHYSIRPSLTSLGRDKAADLDLYTRSHDIDGGYFRGAIGASETLLREEELPNFLFFVQAQENASPGRQSAQALRRAVGQGEMPSNLMWHLENLLTDMDGVTNEIYRTVTGTNDNLIERTWIDPWVVTESIPDPESRIMLVDSRDPIFGQNQVAMDWRMASGQLEVFVRATEILAQELGRLGYGRIWSALLNDPESWPTYPAHGKHHCGTTRMSDDPRSGVVDADCRIHGVSNLFVASSAVFPTQGAATPTLTIVALSVRLADHLKIRLAEGDL